MTQIKTLFDVGDIVTIKQEGGKWIKLVSNKRPTYIKGQIYNAKAKILEINIRKYIVNGESKISSLYLVHYLNKEEDNIFAHYVLEKNINGKIP